MKKYLEHWGSLFQLILDQQSVPLLTQKIVFILILVACLGVRVVTIDAPALDRADWKEIDYLYLSTNYWENGFNFFRPAMNWPAEPPYVTAMEFPLVPYMAGLLYSLFGFHVFSVRVITLVSFLLLIYYMFALSKKELGPVIGLLTAFSSALIPLYQPHGNILFSEPLMITTSVMTLFYFSQWIDYQKRRDYWLSLISFALTISLKMFPLYLLLPIAWITFRKYRWQLHEYRRVAIFVLLSVIVPVAWYSYAYYLRVTSIDFFNIDSRKFETFAMLSDLTWYSTMYKRVAWMILGGKIGTFLCLCGLIAAAWVRRGGLFFLYLLINVIFFLIAAQANYGSIDYQLAIIPPLSVFVAIGAMSILLTGVVVVNSFRKFNFSIRPLKIVCLIGSIVLISMIGIRMNRNIFGKDPLKPAIPDRWELAQEMRRHAQSDSKLVTTGEYAVYYGGKCDLGPVVYYYSGLRGWSLQRGEWNNQHIQRLIEKGATHFAGMYPYGNVSKGPKFARLGNTSEGPEFERFLEFMKTHYKVLYEKTGERPMFLLDLRQPIAHQ